MKLVVVCSSLDLATPFSATPAWWQLLKALCEEGVDLIATTYHGAPSESPWWRTRPNPAQREGDLFQAGQRLFHRRTGSARRTPSETASDRLVRTLARAIIAPRWTRHLEGILSTERGVDALLFLSVPPNHLRGVASSVERRFGIPTFFFDGDVPASLPDARGFASGFNIYPGADLAEFRAVISSSLGGVPALQTLGARAVHTVYYGADPDVYHPVPTDQDTDVFFYGHTMEFRRQAIHDLLTVPSLAMVEAAFAVRGVHLDPGGRVAILPYRGFSDLPRYIAQSRINLVITRRPHAEVYASSTHRPFELALMGACMVSNPYLGIEEWFEPGKEILIVESAEEAVDRYRFLLAHDAARRALGAAARRRALAQHTMRHRARQLKPILSGEA